MHHQRETDLAKARKLQKVDKESQFKQNNLNIKTIRAQLQRIVKNGDSNHLNLYDRRAHELEIVKHVGLLCKIQLKDRTPPCIIRFKGKGKRFRVFYSFDRKEPEGHTNCTQEINVSKYETIKAFVANHSLFLYSLRKLYCLESDKLGLVAELLIVTMSSTKTVSTLISYQISAVL